MDGSVHQIVLLVVPSIVLLRKERSWLANVLALSHSLFCLRWLGFDSDMKQSRRPRPENTTAAAAGHKVTDRGGCEGHGVLLEQCVEGGRGVWASFIRGA